MQQSMTRHKSGAINIKTDKSIVEANRKARKNMKNLISMEERICELEKTVINMEKRLAKLE